MKVPLIGVNFYAKWIFVAQTVFPLDESSPQRVFPLSSSHCSRLFAYVLRKFTGQYSNILCCWCTAHSAQEREMMRDEFLAIIHRLFGVMTTRSSLDDLLMNSQGPLGNRILYSRCPSHKSSQSAKLPCFFQYVGITCNSRDLCCSL